MKKLLFIFLFVSLCLQAIDLSMANNSYKKARIKTKAQKGVSTRGICYIYVNINGNRAWKERKDAINLDIRNNRSRCRKYIIYKVIQNVHTHWYNGVQSRNSNNSKYAINLGAILEENSDVDISIQTIVKNSNISRGFGAQEVNTGIVSKGDTSMDNREYNVNTTVSNSRIGKKDEMTEFGLRGFQDFLEHDNDSPF